MSSKTVINIGRAYTRFPLGRKKQHGKGSGEEFRELFLLPALQGESPTVVIELDDTLGYGSSFLEEAFGGLVRAGYKPDFLKSS
ncbi:MAG: STAS-like domain-containing protein [Pseudomonadota bacterium]